ncbi:MAG TPA: TRAP transporter small permease [Geminicoccus sp.]|uniref:TRAP transporter small permease n=1 Tax=Geminicoccus sp. TaxID=2024832 RepID=UPI002E34EF16|nr:TRAP transporter small permease [Geminicoccus sp.]HEX2527607.1 TRAP transporter small permease [Geminicoccus sp.]
MTSLAFWVNRITDAILVLGIAVIAAVLVTQVFCRYVLHAALPWPEELAQILLVVISFLGMYRAFGKDQHIRIDWLPKHSRPVRLLRALSLLLVAGFLAYIGLGGWWLATGAWDQPTTALRLPTAIPYLIMPLACLLSIAAVAAAIRTALMASSRSAKAP